MSKLPGSFVTALFAQICNECSLCHILGPEVDCDYHPPIGSDLAVVLQSNEAREEAIRLSKTGSRYTRAVHLEWPFLNLFLNVNCLELAEQPTQKTWSGMDVAVEHTSLTPAYPLNLATLRSTILGEWCVRATTFLGANTRAHFWVDECARQVELWAPRAGSSLTKYGKADHVAGALCIDALLEGKMGIRSRRTAAIALFPEAKAGVFEHTEDIRSGGDTCDLLRTYCDAIQTTMNRIGISPVQFDFWYDVIGSIDWRTILRGARSEVGPYYSLVNNPMTMTTSDLSYLERNIIYYANLTLNHDYVYTIVPLRQVDLVRAALSGVAASTGADKRVKLMPYGDVLVDGELDSLKELRFHSVDALTTKGPEAVLATAIYFLSTRASSRLSISSKDLVERRLLVARGHVKQSDPRIQAVLLVDELPRLLAGALASGSFSLVMTWCAHAKKILDLIRYESAVASQLSAARELFDPRLVLQ